METIAIVEAFKELPDGRRAEGKRHEQALCLALFTLAVSAGNRGFLAIGDWLESYKRELIKMFAPPKLKMGWSVKGCYIFPVHATSRHKYQDYY